MTFEDLKLIQPILKAVKEEGYTEPTPIQAQSIPLVLGGEDLLGCAQTGTGKTAAFSIPIIQHLYNSQQGKKGRRKVRALIVTPTRELAIQIGESFSAYGRHTGIRNAVIFGGVKQHSQTSRLQTGVDALIATPGRLLDLMSQGYISLKDVEYFVLDEADRMLDMGFIHDIRKLLNKLPSKRQSLFFSATMPNAIVELSEQILYNPVKVEVAAVSSTAETIQQHLYTTNKASKFDLLMHILDNPALDQVLIFSRTKHGADKLVRKLLKKNVKSAAIHGNKSQNQRQNALSAFKMGKIRTMVATDIAARGIDIDKLQYVVNYDIPNEPETYVHRIGRCGRAGEDGYSISIADVEEMAYIKDIEKLIKQKISRIEDNPFPQTDKPLTKEEKKQEEKEKNKKRQAFFEKRRKKEGSNAGRNQKGPSANKSGGSGGNQSKNRRKKPRR